MYISTPCPKCKKQVCIDLTITEKLTPATAESTILDVDMYVCISAVSQAGRK